MEIPLELSMSKIKKFNPTDEARLLLEDKYQVLDKYFSMKLLYSEINKKKQGKNFIESKRDTFIIKTLFLL